MMTRNEPRRIPADLRLIMASTNENVVKSSVSAEGSSGTDPELSISGPAEIEFWYTFPASAGKDLFLHKKLWLILQDDCAGMPRVHLKKLGIQYTPKPECRLVYGTHLAELKLDKDEAESVPGFNVVYYPSTYTGMYSKSEVNIDVGDAAKQLYPETSNVQPFKLLLTCTAGVSLTLCVQVQCDGMWRIRKTLSGN